MLLKGYLVLDQDNKADYSLHVPTRNGRDDASGKRSQGQGTQLIVLPTATLSPFIPQMESC